MTGEKARRHDSGGIDRRAHESRRGERVISLLQADPTECFLCGKNGLFDRLEKHHIFGAYNRQKSERDGLFVFLCGDECHRNGKHAVHRDQRVMDALHKAGQKAWEDHYGTREEFMRKYGKNYLEE